MQQTKTQETISQQNIAKNAGCARVDFYLLDQAGTQAILQYACRLSNKAYGAGLRIFLLSESEQQSKALEDMLWTSSDANFIPHALAGSLEAGDPLTRICIGDQLPEASGFDMLVNLQTTEQTQGSEFARVAELVSADEPNKQAARHRYAAWRDSGAVMKLHNIHL